MSSENVSGSSVSSKAEIIKKFQRSKNDCGSPEVQVALLTQRIGVLTEHFEKFPNDTHSKRGLHAMVSRRKTLLSYLKDEDVERYRKTLADLGLRK